MMKKLFAFLIFSLGWQSAFATQALVKKIVDGDTFIANIVLKDGVEVRSVSVRLRNVDTPELHGNCDYEIERAKFAKQRLGELIPEGSIIEIKNITNDKYQGRIDANVFDSQNRDVGSILVREKVGRAYSGGKRKSWCNKN